MFTTFAHAGHDHDDDDSMTHDQMNTAPSQATQTHSQQQVPPPQAAEFSPLPIVLVGAGAILAVAVFISIVLYKSRNLKKPTSKN